MRVVVIANKDSRKEFENKVVPEGTEVHFETSVSVKGIAGDVCFYLLSEGELQIDKNYLGRLEIPVFVNAVVTTLKDLPINLIRVNAWPGFFTRSVVELAASEKLKEQVSLIMETLKWDYQFVPDIVGMLTARTISMIINEAYFALGERVSTKEDIDIAMKLGTNYPYGPFEWAEKIGLQNIVSLLKTLSEKESRYTVAPALLNEIKL